VREPEPVVLSGWGVRLEPLSTDHADDLADAAQDDEVWRWLPVVPPRTADDVRAIVRSHPGRPAFAVVVDGRAQGSTAYLDVDLAVGGLEIGWTWYARPLWGTSVTPACKLLLLEHAFDALGAERVTLKTDRLNTRSQAAIRKLGAQYDGTLRHARRRPDGSVRDTAYFSILVAEWPGVRDGLRARLAGQQGVAPQTGPTG
jgi:RimJ/RimL family protein N-acetyltransferase